MDQGQAPYPSCTDLHIRDLAGHADDKRNLSEIEKVQLFLRAYNQSSYPSLPCPGRLSGPHSGVVCLPAVV